MTPSTPRELTFEVPARPMRLLGLVMKMGPITGVQANSPAAAAGLKVGDVITAVDGQSLDAAKSPPIGSPTRSPSECGRRPLPVKRSRSRSRANREQTAKSRSRRACRPSFIQLLPPRAPMGVPALGIAYRIENEVAAVHPDSPAAAAEIEPGDTITAAKIHLPQRVPIR